MFSSLWQLKITVLCFLASYLIAWGLELARLSGRSRVSQMVALTFTFAGLLAHSIYLVRRSLETGLPPLLGSAHDWLLVLAWVLVLFYLYFSLLHRELALGVFLLPVVLLLIAATYLTTGPTSEPAAHEIGLRRWKMLHASFLVLGTGGVAAGFIASLMYLLQHRRLRTRHPTQDGWRLPSLETLAQLTRWTVMSAFLLLTLGIATGMVLSVEYRRQPLSVLFRDPQVLAGCLVWLVLAAVLAWLVSRRQPSGKQVAWMSISACGFLLLAIIGLQAVTGTNHPVIKASDRKVSCADAPLWAGDCS